MALLSANRYTKLQGLRLKGTGKTGEGSGAIALPNVSTAPNPTDSHTIYVEGDALKFWNGSSAVTVGAAGSSGASLDTGYDNGRTISVNAGSLNLQGVNEDTAVLALSGDGDSAGALITFSHTTNTRNDVLGTGSTWKVTGQGKATFDTAYIPNIAAASSSNVNLAIDAAGTGTIAIGGVSTGAVTITPALTATTSLTITGSEGSDVLTVTAGDVALSDGSLTVTDDDNVVSLKVTNNTATTVGAAAATGVVELASTSLTTGTLLHLELTEGTLNGGHYLKAWDVTAGAAVFSVAEDGATTIGGVGGSDVLTVTAGDVVISDGSITVTDADNAATLSLTNNTATTAAVYKFAGSGAFTGTTTSSFLTITPTGMTTGTALYIAGAAATTLSTLADFTTSTTTGTALRLTTTGVQTGVGSALEIVADSATTPGASAGEGVVKISADGLTTGTALDVTSTAGNALTTGRIADFSHISGNITGTLNKTADFFNVSSARTVTTGTVADDYDMANLIRTSVINGGGSFSATGSVLYVENAVTNTSGTVSDTVNGLELVMDSLGTGDGVKITHAATGGKALNIIGAATSVSDVLITGSGVKADNKASLEVVNTGATAAGGSVLRVTNTGTPAAATSYLVDFDYSGATMTNNPVTMFVNGKDSTGAVLQLTSSGAAGAGHLEVVSTNTGAVGPVVKLTHTSTGSAAANDVVGRLLVAGLDDADAAESYARIDVIAQDVAAANPDASLNFLVDRAGTLTLGLTVGWDDTAGAAINGISVGDGSGQAIVTSNAAQDLVLSTNGGTNSGTITITDAANGAITLAPNGSGLVDLAGKVVVSETTTSSGAGAISITGAIHEITSTGVGDAMTLADGTEGQILHIVHVTDGGSAVITPTNMAGGTTITMDAVGDAVTLLFTAGKWFVVGQNSVTIG